MKSLPPRLYKYLHPDRGSVLRDWLLRFTQPVALNDPFEMRPHIAGYDTSEKVRKIAERNWEAWAREAYNERVRVHGPIVTFEEYRKDMEQHRERHIAEAIAKSPEYNPEMARRIDEMMNEAVGVLSLCEHPDNLLMWAHYGDSHRGFVIEFDTASPFFHQTQPPAHVRATDEEVAQFAEECGRLRPITYIPERPSVLVVGISFDVIMSKGQQWEYEGEWRMLMPPQYANVSSLAQPRPRPPVCLFEVPPSAVTRIILGANCDDALLAEAKQLREREDTRHIAIEKARVDDKRYFLHFDPV